jgi:molecular chaperone GrpE
MASEPEMSGPDAPQDIDEMMDPGVERASEIDDVTDGLTRPDADEAVASDVIVAEEAVEHDVEALLAERDEFKDIALRLQADFENYRRRVLTQQADEVDRATARLVEELLPVLDACEAAFGHGVEGVEPIWSALLGALQRQGLEVLDLQDQPFDPAVAEAVLHEPDDDPGSGPVVVEVLRTGYQWKGRVLRAAMVKVRG